MIVTSGGIGGNHDLVRAQWPERLGTPPEKMLSGVPAHVDGLMLGIAEEAGAHHINRDRMWHYTEGIENWNPIWAKHGIRILPGPSSLWLDARGKRLPVPLFPGFDTLGTLEHIMRTGYDYTWFVLNQKIIGKEFALSGSEQNPDLTGKSVTRRDRPGARGRARAGEGVHGPRRGLRRREGPRRPGPRHERAHQGPLIDEAELRREIAARDREIANPFTKDLQVTAIRGARRLPRRQADPHGRPAPHPGPQGGPADRRTPEHPDPQVPGRPGDGPLLPGADRGRRPRCRACTRRARRPGFGGGGVHGYRSLEGTFLGGCIFSGRAAGRAAAKAL